MPSPRPLVLLLAAVLALGLPACGQEEREAGGYQTENAQLAETEGIYLEVGDLKYQVQLSRQMNPRLLDDRAYFEGVSEGDLDLADDEVWFGIWMRVENESPDPHPAATRFTIVDTQENEYVPVRIGEPNPFAYRGGTVGGEELLPNPNSAAGERAPNGAVMLFKLKRFSLDNRPLELIIEPPDGGRRGIVNLDV
ncbi:MAG TPA: hypothetical protein VGW75_01975 [Solirubrobacteraceae bacterium]|nr:hypothetical protein [Solirubrobacteraceae bacterium]